MLAFTSCSTEPKGEGAGFTAVQPGEAGGVTVQTYKETATVTGVDKATRKVTLVTKDGAKSTVKCGPEVANFDQIEVGDQVKATVTEQLVVFVRNPGDPSGDGSAAAIALAPLGAKPEAVMANTEEITAKVKSIDLKHRKATLLVSGWHEPYFQGSPGRGHDEARGGRRSRVPPHRGRGRFGRETVTSKQ